MGVPQILKVIYGSRFSKGKRPYPWICGFTWLVLPPHNCSDPVIMIPLTAMLLLDGGCLVAATEGIHKELI